MPRNEKKSGTLRDVKCHFNGVNLCFTSIELFYTFHHLFQLAGKDE